MLRLLEAAVVTTVVAAAVSNCAGGTSSTAAGGHTVVWPPYQPVAGRKGYFTSIGNHRFNVTVHPAATETGAGEPVVASIPWRRSDATPLAKAVYVTSSANSSTPLPCSFVGQPSADSATVSFTTMPQATEYFIYYMPFSTCEYAGGTCVFGAQVTYDPADAPGSCGNSSDSREGEAPEATVAPLQGVYQSRAPFESFEPMEMPMSSLEASTWLNARSAQPFIVVPEVREHVVKMRTKLPSRWVDVPVNAPLQGTAQPGEHYSFQLVVVNMKSEYAVAQALPLVQPFCVPMSDMVGAAYYIKVGGNPNSTIGWQKDPGSTDPTGKCCRSAVAACYWFPTKAACGAALNKTSCLPCAIGESSLGCPSWGMPPAPPPLVVSVVTFSDLTMQGQSIPASALACMNTEGSDFWGRDFKVDHVYIPANEVKPLWVKLVVPPDAASGTWRGFANITAAGHTVSIPLQLTIQGQPVQNGGDDDIERGTRIHWFDSKLALGGDTVPSPFAPITVAPSTDGLSVQMLAKKFSIGPSGLPTKVLITADTLAGTPLAVPRNVLGDNVSFEVHGLSFPTPKLTAGTTTNMSVSWTSVATDSAGAAYLNVTGSVDCTGYTLVNITMTAKSALANAGVRLRLPSNPDTAFFAMGLGQPGGSVDSWIGEDQQKVGLASWLVFDFQRSVTLDGFRLYGHGDGVHDVTKHYLQAASSSSTPKGISWAAVVGYFTGKKSEKMQQDYTFKPATARIWRWVITDVVASTLCAGTGHCQPDVAEVEFREAGKAFASNAGTANSSLVIESSGGDTPANPAWKAVDGKLIYVDYKDGWDAGMAAGPPDAPQPPPPPMLPTNMTWSWDGKNGNNAVWYGSTKAGVRLELKGEDPLWWAGSPYDSGSSPDPPDSWSNSKQGGIQAYANGTAVAFSGPRAMVAGESISYVFSLMVTPVRPFDLKERFQERWAQLSGPSNYSHLADAGVTVVNMHQGNEINPWINYPYLTNDAMKYAADACHKLGMQYSVYNTMRELSDRCTEYFPMLSFNETLVPGAGGGADWLQEHIRTGYLPAWSNPVPPAVDTAAVPNPDPLEGSRLQDAGMRVKALSRWNNYYISGLRQIMRDYGADGIYLDEIAYDRTTMLRARKVLGDRGRIDHHADHGFVSQSPVINYMELYPFINRLWYGEGFDYNTPSADYWLVEIAGLETGLSVDMLRYPTMQHSHGMTRYHYRGMLVASSFRYSGAGPFDPTALWKLWDRWKIETSTMIGWWENIEQGNNTVPVRCAEGNSDVKATVFLKHGEAAMIVLADWNEADVTVTCTLDYNWSALGLNQATAKLHAPDLPPFQLGPAARDYKVGETISINVTVGGLLLILE